MDRNYIRLKLGDELLQLLEISCTFDLDAVERESSEIVEKRYYPDIVAESQVARDANVNEDISVKILLVRIVCIENEDAHSDSLRLDYLEDPVGGMSVAVRICRCRHAGIMRWI